MQANKTVYLSKTTIISDVISKLEGRGVVDVKVPTDLDTDTSAIYIKPASIFHPLTRIFSTKKSRQAQADFVCGRLRQALGKDLAPNWLLQNVRTQIEQAGGLTGDFLAKNLKAAENGAGRAQSTGQDLHIMALHPMDIKSDYCLVSFDTASETMTTAADNGTATNRDAMSATQLGLWENREEKFERDSESTFNFTFDGSPANRLLSFRGSSELDSRDRTSAEMYKLIRSGIGESTGAIVIEPQPDQLQKAKPSHTDLGLKAQIRAALTATDEAKSKKINRVITFASPDRVLLQRIKTLYQEVSNEMKAANAAASDSKPGLLDTGNDSSDSDSFLDIDLNDSH